jgi:hypothetical protein
LSEDLRDRYQEFLGKTQRYKQVIVPIRQRLEDAALTFLNTIDLLFVDADHSYEAVVRDLKDWLHKIRASAWILLHDSGWAEGVQRAINDIVVPIQIGVPEALPNLYSVQVDWQKRDA